MEKVAENYKMYLERVELYKKFGYDIEAERKFLLDKSEPLYGDILEVGTGKGYLAAILAKEGHEFISLDISEEEQKLARLHLKHLKLEEKVDFRIGNAENLSFADKSFDIVISSHVVHHLNHPFKVIGEFIRVISYEGKIILSDFSKEGLAVVDKIHK
ncbi:MAG: class I SAM-dependent methyltransferase, partial [Candidatus Omnitrophica bacterium]|nr:class I SAM-dependent methyltransferase [Candidatus Omnitrophota bacterium]